LSAHYFLKHPALIITIAIIAIITTIVIVIVVIIIIITILNTRVTSVVRTCDYHFQIVNDLMMYLINRNLMILLDTLHLLVARPLPSTSQPQAGAHRPSHSLGSLALRLGLFEAANILIGELPVIQWWV
jgi:hypothetical protein